MNDILAPVLILVLFFGCEMEIDYSIDGQHHRLVLNAEPDSKP